MNEHIEYASGYHAGLLHDVENPLCTANIGKSEMGIKDTDHPLVVAYWAGYRAALTQLKII